MWTCFIFRYRYRSVVTTVSGSEKFRAISVWKIFLPADELLHVFLDFGFWSLQWSHHVSSLLERWILCHIIFKWRKTSLWSQRGRKRRGWEHRFLFLLLWSIQIDYVHIFNVTRSSLTVASFGAKKKEKERGRPDDVPPPPLPPPPRMHNGGTQYFRRNKWIARGSFSRINCFCASRQSLGTKGPRT